MRPTDPRVRRQLLPAYALSRGRHRGGRGRQRAARRPGLGGHRADPGRPRRWCRRAAGRRSWSRSSRRGRWSAGRPTRWPRGPRRSSAATYAAGWSAAILRDGGAGRSTGELASLATRGATAAEPYLTRYVPALVLAGVLPCVTLVAIATQDPTSALIVLATLPLIPVFGILVGLATRDRAELAVAGARVAVGPLPRRDARPAHAGRLPPRRRPVGDHPRGHRPLPPPHPGHPADRVRLLGRARAGRDALGRAGGRHRRPPARRRAASTCRPRWWCCCSRPRRTGRCAASARSSTRPPRAWPRFEAAAELDDAEARHGAAARRRRCASTAPDRAAPGPDRARARRRLPRRARPRCHRGHRPLGLRQVHAARGPRGPRSSPPSGTGARGPRRDRIAWLPQRPVFVAGTRRRQPAAGRARRHRRAGSGTRCAGSRCRSGPDLAGRSGHSARRGRHHALRRRARPAGAGPGGARRPALGPARRADRPPRPGHRAARSPTRSPELGRTRAVVVVAHRPASSRSPTGWCELQPPAAGRAGRAGRLGRRPAPAAAGAAATRSAAAGLGAARPCSAAWPPPPASR